MKKSTTFEFAKQGAMSALFTSGFFYAHLRYLDKTGITQTMNENS